MEIALNAAHLDAQVKQIRAILSRNAQVPGEIGASARLALAVFPAFMVAFAAELRQDAKPDHVITAVADFFGNTVASVAETLGDGEEGQKQVLDAILETAVLIAKTTLDKSIEGAAPAEKPPTEH